MSARLFVALDVGAGEREALAAWAAAAVGEDPGLRLVEAAQVHLTLAFLGHRSLDDIDRTAEVVRTVDLGPAPALRTAGPLWLSPRRPHVLTVAVADEDGALAALHERLWSELTDELGVEPEKRALRPHMTVARVRRGWPAPSRRLPELPERPLTPDALVLYRSWLGGGPARYEPLERHAFE